MTDSIQPILTSGSDAMVEMDVPMSDYVPDCIADAGKVRQGGLHRVMQWVIGTILGGGT